MKRAGIGPKPAVKPQATAQKGPKPPKVYPSARAQRPIGLSYDELSRGINPFAMVDTHGVADATDPPEVIAELFNRYGLVKIRGLYSAEKSRALYQHCIDFSGLSPDDFHKVITREKPWGTGGSPVLNDDRFWPYVVEPKLKQVLNQLIGENIFEFGTAVAAHYTARGLHRDYRMLVEADTPFSVLDPQERIVRVLHYCGRNGGALGFIPFSHDERKFAEVAREIGLEHDTAWFDRHREVLKVARKKRNFLESDEIERHVCWAYADPGDVIVSNSAMLHAGEYLTGPRYFFVSTYVKSFPATLDLTADGRMPRFFDYYKFLEQNGFKGAADVLRHRANTSAAETGPDAAMGGSMGGS